VALLLKYGADVNQSDIAGLTPFLSACHSGQREIVKKIITHKGVNPMTRDMSGLTGVRATVS